MPHPKGHVKLSGDTHLPDAESDLAVESGSAGLAGLAKSRTQPRGATRVRHAGVLTAGDDEGRLSLPEAEQEAPGAGQPARGPRREAARPVAAPASAWKVWGFALLGALVLLRLVR